MFDQRSILIVGATSAIGRALAKQLAESGASLHLASRNETELERLSADLSIRFGVPVSWSLFDATVHSATSLIADTLAWMPDVSGAIITHGWSSDIPPVYQTADEMTRAIQVNFSSVAAVCMEFTALLEARGNGFLAVISSVAGDRGRRKNYVYGAAKAGVSAFLQGTRSRLQPLGINVLTVKPGFVDTRLTYGLPGLFGVISPEKAAEKILRAIEKKKDVVYVPWFWRWIMLIVRLIPERLFKRLSF